MRLEVELVPSTSWFTNLRSELSSEQWDVIRKKVYARAKHRCEICGGRGEKWPVEAHEEWVYHEDGRQELARIVALCPMCHKCKHPGLAEIRGELPNVIHHLARVNGVTPDQATEQINAAFEIWRQRSQREWVLDIERIRLWAEKQENHAQHP